MPCEKEDGLKCFVLGKLCRLMLDVGLPSLTHCRKVCHRFTDTQKGRHPFKKSAFNLWILLYCMVVIKSLQILNIAPLSYREQQKFVK